MQSPAQHSTLLAASPKHKQNAALRATHAKLAETGHGSVRSIALEIGIISPKARLFTLYPR